MKQEHERTYSEADLLAAFHRQLSREEAEALLAGQPAGTFLVRESQRNPATTDHAHQKDSSTSALLVLSCVAGAGGSPGENSRFEHTQVKLQTMAKVEGFFFVRQPGRVRPSLYALLNRMPAFRFPLRASAPSIAAAAATSANEERNAVLESTMATGSPLLDSLVDELLLAVLAHLSPFDLVLLSLVCKQLYVLSKDDTIWRHKYCSEFGAWVPPVQCNPTSGLSWKLKYWLEYNLIYRSPTEAPFVFSGLEGEAKEPQHNETFVRYSDTHPSALVLSHKIPISANAVNQGKSLVFRVQCGDKVGYSLHQHPSKPDMVHSDLASLVRAATNFPQWSVTTSKPLLFQLRLAALGHIRELVFVTTTPRDWHQLVSVVTADPPHLRSLVVRASYGSVSTARSVLQCLATANKGLQFLCLSKTQDLEKIPDVIRKHPELRVLALDLKSDCSPDTLHFLLEPLAHSRALQRITINFRAAARAGSVGQSLNFSALPGLLRACRPQVVKVGLYGVPAPIKAQIDQAVAQRPGPPMVPAAAGADHLVRFKVVTTPAKPWRSPYSASREQQQQQTSGEWVEGRAMADIAYVSGLDPSARQYQFDDMLTRWRNN